MNDNITQDLRLLLIPDIAKQYPQYGSISSWQWRVYKEDENGLKLTGVIVRCLGRVYINIDAWEKFMLS